MPGFDAQFCKMLEIEYLAIKKTLDLIIIYPEQFAEKIKSYCFRVANILFRSVLLEIAFWRDQILSLKNIILKSKYYKNTRRICLDLLRCQKALELCAGKPFFGNKTQEEFKANSIIFEQYVCNGKLIEAAQALLNSAVATVDALIIGVRNAMEMWTSIGFNYLLAQYTAVLNLYGIPALLEKLEAFADCVFGACDIGASIVNFKEDLQTRLGLNANAQVDRSKFKAILDSGINKIEGQISSLESEAAQSQENWHKVAKDAISHN